MCPWLATALLLTAGCARYPDTPVEQANDLLLLELSTAQPINSSYYYYFAIDTNGQAEDGPLPVAGGPFFGNGWGTGSFTRYVVYHAGIFDYYRAGPDNDPPPFSLGPPFFTQRPSVDEPNRLGVALDMQTLLDPGQQLPVNIEVNMITVNVLVQPGDPAPPERDYDGLGPGGNSFFIVGTQIERIHSNETDPIETEGDTSVPALDIVDWRLEVRKGD